MYFRQRQALIVSISVFLLFVGTVWSLLTWEPRSVYKYQDPSSPSLGGDDDDSGAEVVKGK